jgi:hypothetical protein
MTDRLLVHVPSGSILKWPMYTVDGLMHCVMFRPAETARMLDILKALRALALRSTGAVSLIFVVNGRPPCFRTSMCGTNNYHRSEHDAVWIMGSIDLLCIWVRITQAS